MARKLDELRSWRSRLIESGRGTDEDIAILDGMIQGLEELQRHVNELMATGHPATARTTARSGGLNVADYPIPTIKPMFREVE